MAEDKLGIAPEYQLPDKLWERIKPLLPLPKPKKKQGGPREDDRQMMNAIFYIMRTGCQWKAIPRSLGASSTVHDRFQEWQQAGVFQALWQAGVLEYDQVKGINWEWQAMDGAMTKAPLGRESTGPNPTDRGKKGTKRSLLTEGNGVPIGLAVEGANRHDMKLTQATLESHVVERPEPTPDNPQHLCLDKGYDFDAVREFVAARSYIAHIMSRGKEAQEKREICV